MTSAAIKTLGNAQRAKLGRRRRLITRRALSRVPTLAILSVVGIIMVFPTIWIVSTAFNNNGGLATGNLLPTKPSLYNFRELLNVASSGDPVLRWLLNSIGVSVVAAVGVAVIDSLAAFALARLQFRGSKVVFYVVVSSLMVPFIAVLLPQYLWFHWLGLLNTYGALILPYTANAFGVFLLYQFFLGIPRELQEATTVDGAGPFTMWYRLFVPLSVGITGTLALLTFMGVYNDYFWPLIATSTLNMRTITVGIEIVAIGQYQTNFGALMALTVISVVPMLVVFVFAQRRLVEGVAMSGLGGV
jgi:multiple sugar transport system permease protein